MSQAVYPQFSRQQERRATFTNWPLNHCFRPDDLVMQGFYYAGYADCIRCFYCGVGLKSWDERDDVMKEHIRWRPSCGYVLNTKGRQFVSNTQRSLQVENSPQAINPQGNIAASSSTHGTSALSSGTTSTATRTVSTTNTGTARTTRPPVTTGTDRPTAPGSQNTLHPSGSGATNSPGATTSGPNPHTTPRRTPNDVAGQTPSRSDSANAAAVPSSLPSESSSSASASATACGNVGVQASREVLRKVEEMGFSKDSIARAVRHLQRTGVARVSADELVETILAVNASDTATTSTDNTENNVETDGDSTSQNHSTLQSEHAQIVMSENERLRARQTCKICHEARVGMIFLPCGHVVACTQCGARTRHCTNCGQFIRATANVYMS